MDAGKEFDRRVEERWYGQLDQMRKDPVGEDLVGFLNDLAELPTAALEALAPSDYVHGTQKTDNGLIVHLRGKIVVAKMEITPGATRTVIGTSAYSATKNTRYCYEALRVYGRPSLEDVITEHLDFFRAIDERLSAAWMALRKENLDDKE